MNEYHLNQTINNLEGPSREQIVVGNQWAAVALDKFHKDSEAKIALTIDNQEYEAVLKWDSEFSKAAMKEKTEMANHGGVAMAYFVMSVLLNYGYLEQSEIGEGVDYRFSDKVPGDDDLNFLDNFHYVEVSGILKESPTNTLQRRLKIKHEQITRGSKSDKESSVIVTLFSKLETVKEIHN